MQSDYKKSYEELVLRNISKFGWHCTSVHGSEKAPSFSYTIGLFKTFGRPELILFGVSSSLGHELFSVAANEYSKGRHFNLGQPIEGLLEGYSCKFVVVPPSEAEKYALSAVWYYKGKPFPINQIVWPSAVDGLFPWESGATEKFKNEQPVLGPVP